MNSEIGTGDAKGVECFNGLWIPYDVHEGTLTTNLKRTRHHSANGFIEEWYNTEDVCQTNVAIPGTSLLPDSLTGFAYFIFLLFLFLGISVVADIFMESIEVITSSTRKIQVVGEDGISETIESAVWNPTIANLTLLSLGSSAPEILLSVIEQLKTLGEPAAILGTASIVGAGAFNLLVISGISILSVDEPKKIYDVGVYAWTATSSLLAYFWMFVVLSINTPGLVTTHEAWTTLGFMVILVTVAFTLDKWQQRKDRKSATDEEKAEK